MFVVVLSTVVCCFVPGVVCFDCLVLLFCFVLVLFAVLSGVVCLFVLVLSFVFKC